MRIGERDFNGSIDEVRIWNRALSAEEIKASYDTKQNNLFRRITSTTNNSYSCTAYAEDSQSFISNTEARTFNLTNNSNSYLLTAVGPAIINLKILPDTSLVTLYSYGYDASSSISLQTSKGEYTAASFVVSSDRDLANLKITVSNLTSGENIIPSDNIDIKAVKVWWQSGTDTIGRTRDLNVLAPELLLHDDTLVKIEGTENFIKGYNCDGCYINISQPRFPLKISNPTEFQTKENYLIANVKPVDADTLQPVNISANTLKQFWVTVHIPQDAISGNYSGSITLDSNGAFPVKTIALQTEVLPFTLEEPVLEYSIYYRSKLTANGSISSEDKTEEQFRAEIKNIFSHGVINPNLYGQIDNTYLAKALNIRSETGISNQTLYYLGHPQIQSYGNDLVGLKNSVTNLKNFLISYGVSQLYIYAPDEKSMDNPENRAQINAVHEVGGKVFNGQSKDKANSIVDVLDMAIVSLIPDAVLADKYHSYGHKIYNYANPQLGVEQPETYRRNYGLILWKSGYDGAMDYAYQHSFDFGWNDFDHETYKDHVMAYPTMNGVIDTIQWEGFREGVNDVRYLTTLLKYINLAKAQTGNTYNLGVQAENWINTADLAYGDLNQIRKEMISQTKNIYAALSALTPDTTLPSIYISSPTNNATVSNPSITVSGAASDNVALSKVEVKLNSGSYQTATGTTSWSLPLTLISGTNTITARATDTSNNIKETSISVTYTPVSGGGGGSGGGSYSDTTPPAKPSDFKATSADKQITLAWKNPTDSDFVRVIITRKENSAPVSKDDGTVIYEGTDQTYTDINLDNTKTYYYAIFAYDAKPNYSQALSLSAQPQAGITPPITPTGIVDGALLKTPDSFKVYVIIQGKKKWIPTPEVFETLGYKWGSITIVDANTIKSLPDFEDNLIRANNTIQVYLVVNGVRHHIPNPEIFLDYGFKWDEVKDVPQAAIDQYRLVRLIRESGQGKIYYLSSSGVKKWIPNPEVFASYNNKWEDIQVISNKEMISYPESNLMKLAGSNNIYLIQLATKRLIPSIDVFNKYKYDWNLVLEANQMEFEWYKTGSKVN